MPGLETAFTDHRIPRKADGRPGHGRARRATSFRGLVNDVHSQLNQTRVARVIAPTSVEELQSLMSLARARRQSLSIAGGMHAMGGQQFATDDVLLDMKAMNRVVRFDHTRGQIEVEAGIHWPSLIDFTVEVQRNSARQVGIIQKQTGADRLSIGGALAANIHGRGLRLKPIIGDIESFVLVDANGATLTCSRQENAELFRLTIGGYGLFGIIARVTLRLAPRQRLERVAIIADLCNLSSLFEQRIAEGFVYGDFQFATARDSQQFLRRGVFSCYRPVRDDTPMRGDQRELSAEDWKQLIMLAHTDHQRAFEMYSQHYLATSGQIYWSDTHQLSLYLDDYHRELDQRLKVSERGSEMITELYVPRDALAKFMEMVRKDFRAHSSELIYGTIRLIERDDESFLAWAKESYACVVFNLHVTHTPSGIEKAKRDFRRLIDRAIHFGGTFYVAYHRWATREQILTCYPQFPEFLRLKLHYDPYETFKSDWYSHYLAMFG